jgi:hypothetical protein
MPEFETSMAMSPTDEAVIVEKVGFGTAHFMNAEGGITSAEAVMMLRVWKVADHEDDIATGVWTGPSADELTEIHYVLTPKAVSGMFLTLADLTEEWVELGILPDMDEGEEVE